MKKNSFLAKFYMFMVFFFLFAPIVVMILFSFNAGKSTYGGVSRALWRRRGMGASSFHVE